MENNELQKCLVTVITKNHVKTAVNNLVKAGKLTKIPTKVGCKEEVNIIAKEVGNVIRPSYPEFEALSDNSFMSICESRTRGLLRYIVDCDKFEV